jgi:hydrogenase large subunit
VTVAFLLQAIDFSAEVVSRLTPKDYERAKATPCQFRDVHGFGRVSDIMDQLYYGKAIFREAMRLQTKLRELATIIWQRYPQPLSLKPGGISVRDPEVDRKVKEFLKQDRTVEKLLYIMAELREFYSGVYKKIEEDFVTYGLLEGQEYNADYEEMDYWADRRFVPPALTRGGELAETRLSRILLGVREIPGGNYEPRQKEFETDELANPLSEFHPWNKKAKVKFSSRDFLPIIEQQGGWKPATGDLARLYSLSLRRGKVEALGYRWESKGNDVITVALLKEYVLNLEVPQGNTEPLPRRRKYRLAVGAHDATRGGYAHWLVVEGESVRNYQIVTPTDRNFSPNGGPVERSIVGQKVTEEVEVTGLDALRVVRSFDPCSACAVHMEYGGRKSVIQVI